MIWIDALCQNEVVLVLKIYRRIHQPVYLLQFLLLGWEWGMPPFIWWSSHQLLVCMCFQFHFVVEVQVYLLLIPEGTLQTLVAVLWCCCLSSCTNSTGLAPVLQIFVLARPIKTFLYLLPMFFQIPSAHPLLLHGVLAVFLDANYLVWLFYHILFCATKYIILQFQSCNKCCPSFPVIVEGMNCFNEL